MATETVWRLRGDVMETCSCATTCPCNFGSDPIPLPCEVVLGWRIADGHYGNTRLDGLNVVLYGRIPGNAFQGNWTVGVYLDQNADQQQAQALGNIFSGQAGGWPAVLGPLIGNMLAPKQVSIRFETIDGEHRITVPGLLEASSERVPNPLAGQPPLDPKVSDLAVPFYTGAARVRRSRTLRLTEPNMAFEYSGRSALIGSFDYSGPQRNPEKTRTIVSGASGSCWSKALVRDGADPGAALAGVLGVSAGDIRVREETSAIACGPPRSVPPPVEH